VGTVTLSGFEVKIAAALLSALTIGSGAMLLSVNKDQAVQNQRLETLERNAAKLDQIDKTLQDVDKKVVGLTQRFNDEFPQNSR
jgi:hypothetical protein